MRIQEKKKTGVLGVGFCILASMNGLRTSVRALAACSSFSDDTGQASTNRELSSPRSLSSVLSSSFWNLSCSGSRQFLCLQRDELTERGTHLGDLYHYEVPVAGQILSAGLQRIPRSLLNVPAAQLLEMRELLSGEQVGFNCRRRCVQPGVLRGGWLHQTGPLQPP